MRVAFALAAIMAVLFAAQGQAQNCSCPSALDVDYTSDIIPDAAKDAYTTIVLNENTWEVEFTVHNVLHLNNGHVVANKLDTRIPAAGAFAAFVEAFTASELWSPPNCSVGTIDTPASSLGIEVTRYDNCTKSYKMIFSLVNPAKQNYHCQLVADADDLNIGCSLILSSTRAYDLTESSAFLSAETAFTANITLPRNLNRNVSDVFLATQAKCNVLNAPDFAIDCRIPGRWNFKNNFTVNQNIPDWVNPGSCRQSQTPVATFLRCDLNSVPVTEYTEASANITASIEGANEDITFSVDYTLPRRSNSTASGSLQDFIVSIGMQGEKYFYAGGDRVTMIIETYATERLTITDLAMFNSQGQVYKLRDYPQFQLRESSNSTHFIIEFRPSAIRGDSNFYRQGPHGVNISFQFNAASNRRQQEGAGFVVFDGINIRPDEAAIENVPGEASPITNPTSGDSVTSPTAQGSSSTTIVAIIACAVVLIVGAIAAAVYARTRTQIADAKSPHKEPEVETVPENQV